MADNEVTIGEINRRLDRIERDIRTQFDNINQTIRNQEFVHREVFAEVLKSIASDQQAQWDAIREINEREKRKNQWMITGILLPVLLIVILQILQLR